MLIYPDKCGRSSRPPAAIIFLLEHIHFPAGVAILFFGRQKCLLNLHCVAKSLRSFYLSFSLFLIKLFAIISIKGNPTAYSGPSAPPIPILFAPPIPEYLTP